MTRRYAPSVPSTKYACNPRLCTSNRSHGTMGDIDGKQFGHCWPANNVPCTNMICSDHGAIKPQTFIRFFHGKYYSIISNRDVDLLKNVQRNFKFSLKIQNSFEGWSIVIIKKNINKFFITEIWNSLNAIHSSPRSTSISNRYPRYYGEISISWYVENTIVEAKTSVSTLVLDEPFKIIAKNIRQGLIH